MYEREQLKEDFATYLKRPTDKAYADLIKKLEFYKMIPPCPECNSTRVVRDGTHPRKTGRVQQFWCKNCNHSYTLQSIESKKRRAQYPPCPQCKGAVIKNGYVPYTLKDGTVKRLEKYRCLRCNTFFFPSKR